MTTPTLVIAFVRNEHLTAADVEALLTEMRDARSWHIDRYVVQAMTTFERQMPQGGEVIGPIKQL